MTRQAFIATALWLALAHPAPARPLGSCEVGVGEESSLPCVGGDCRCLRVVNACPFPVLVAYETGDGQRTVGVPSGSGTATACASGLAPGRVSFLGWRPAPGYPRHGQPVPMDAASMTGPVSAPPP